MCGAQAGGDTATPYVAIQYRSNIDHFRVAPVGGQSRWFGALCGTRDAYSANRTGPCPPLLFFSHDEKERGPTKERVIGGLDGSFVRGTRWLLPCGREGGRGFRTLRIMITSILYLQRERTLVVSGILIAQPPARGYVYTHVRERTSDLCVLPLEFIGSRWAKFRNGRGREKKETVHEEKRGGGRLRGKVRKS